MTRIKKLIKSWTLVLLVFGIGFALVASATFWVQTRAVSVVDSDVIPSEFPVLVVDRDASPSAVCRVLYFDDLHRALRGGANLSFVVPPEEQSRCKDDLRGNHGERSLDSRYKEGEAQIRSAIINFGPILESGEQLIEISASQDSDWVNRGWSLAGPDGIRPQSHQLFFGPVVALLSVAAGLIGGCVAAVSLAAIRWRRSARMLRSD